MTKDSANDLGKMRSSLRGSVVAGSYQTCVLTYTAGFAGIDDTGSLKFVMRYATDAGRPQFDDPQAANYVTAQASNDAHLQLRYDIKDNVRPWGKTIHVKVLQGYLRKSDTLTLTIGDRSGGSLGWRMQTFAERTFEIRALVDRYATYVYEQMPKSPVFEVVPGDAVRLVAVAPSVVAPDRKIVVRFKLEDEWGNPVGRPRKLVHAGFAEPDCYTIPVTDEATGLCAETNPIIVADKQQTGRYWADLHGQSEETIGTNSIEDYFRFARDYGFLDACAHQGNDFQITDEFWQEIQATTRRMNRSGKFVTFPGWEWSGNTGLGGDRNVLFRDEGGLISRSSRALLRQDEAVDSCSDNVEQLFDRCESSRPDAMLFAHVGGRYADLERHREGLETAVEVHSAWGTFEWMLDDAFQRGYRVGIVANSDGHKGRPGASYPGASTFGSYGGLTCILATELDRDSVWAAYQDRRVYATTGARMLLDVTAADNFPMGSVLPIDRDTVPELRVRVVGTVAIERIELRNAMQVLKVVRPRPRPRVRPHTSDDRVGRIKLLWQGAEVRGRGRQVTWDGGLQLTGNRIRSFQPINFHNVEKKCVLVSRSQLAWQSITTGGVAGVILDLEKSAAGQAHVRTAQKSFRVHLAKLTTLGRSYRCGGLGKMISAYRLPAAGGRREHSFRFRPQWKQLRKGDNPIYICAIQEDGHMAWSSPIYLVRS